MKSVHGLCFLLGGSGVPDEDLILCNILLCIKMMPRVQRAQDEYTDAYKQSQAPHRSDLVLIVFADGER